MRLTFSILAALLALPALGQWNRYETTGKGKVVSIADPHPLSYFTGEGRLRDICEGWHADQMAKFLAEVKPEESKVGKVGEYTIYDVFYVDSGNNFGGRKSILVQTGKDQYREISYIENGDRYGKTLIVGDSPPNQMLWATTGYGLMGMTADDQFWVGDGMSVRMDFKAVAAAEEATMKSAGIVREKPWNRQMPLPSFESKGYALVSHLPAGDGSVDVTFTIDHGRAVVTGTSYTPSKHQ
jgi:hypothetical protein